jgi:hypothetical protein
MTAFTKIAVAPSRSVKAILREAKIVALVTENWCPQALHLKRRRVEIS